MRKEKHFTFLFDRTESADIRLLSDMCTLLEEGQKGIQNLDTRGDGVQIKWSKCGKSVIRRLSELSESRDNGLDDARACCSQSAET
jgi:hypothetical protein